MTGTARRVTVILGVAAVVAVVATAAMLSGPTAAAKPPADPNAFVITASLKQYTWYASGSFRATGAIDDSGNAGGSWNPWQLVLSGEQGTITISLNVPETHAFTITDGTDAYAELRGGGTFTLEVDSKNSGKDGQEDVTGGSARMRMGSATATYKYTLEGTVTQQ